MPATIKDIASKTGLAIATISKYLNGGNVLEKNRLKIERAVQDLDFRVNQVARGLKTNRTMSVGVIIPRFTGIFFTSIVEPIEMELRKYGYAVILCDSREDLRQEREVLDFLISKKVDGIIAVPCFPETEHFHILRRYGVPTVVIDNGDFCGMFHTVLTDNAGGTLLGTEHLLSMGHRRIGVLCGHQRHYTARERRLGYIQALERRGVPVDEALIRECDYSISDGRRHVDELLSRRPDITAVLATNYDLTLGAFSGLVARRLKIPGDISFVGFDDIEISQVITPRLTLVSQPVDKIGQKAAQTMLGLLGGALPPGDEPVAPVVVPTTLILGDSVARV